jgi:hypothetical protein
LSVSVDEFLETGRGKVFDVADEAIVSKLANAVVDKRTSLREAIERSSLANAILPTYQSSALEIDLRLRFDDQEKVVGGAPVAILGLRTDIEDDFYCQMSLADVRRLLKRLEEAEARLRAGARMLSEFLQ